MVISTDVVGARIDKHARTCEQDCAQARQGGQVFSTAFQE